MVKKRGKRKERFINKILLSLPAGQLLEGVRVHGKYKAAENGPEDILFYQVRVGGVKGLQRLPHRSTVHTHLTGRRTH